MGKPRFDEQQAVETAITWLRERLPDAWEVRPAGWLAGAGAAQIGGALEIQGGQSFATLGGRDGPWQGCDCGASSGQWQCV